MRSTFEKLTIASAVLGLVSAASAMIAVMYIAWEVLCN